ncbi:ribosomal protein S7 domain-containing protein [Rhodotorula diobovata]|uniref:Ribosomal protein S7 domain-containing protein n=1 Tax=Rhodotorula diobovata TaxID=5288 RepID=A0A5C5FXG4_9BASI|nr:ribosomal protein S7 domain-containing protein [Rhodotorula diobovata]
MSRVQATARSLVRSAARPTTTTTWAPAPPSTTHPRLSSSLSAFESGLQGNSPLPASAPSPTTTRTASPPSPSTAPPPTRLPTDPLAVHPDQELLSVLARLIMRDGKLARAHAFLDSMLSHLHLATRSPPLPLLARALDLASPSIRMVGRRKGTKVMQTPQPLTAPQRRRQAWKWIVDASDKRQGTEKDFGKRLAQECLAVLNGQSEALKKVTGTHTLGVTGRANVGR